MMAAKVSEYCSTFARKSFMSTLPWLSQATMTTLIPAMTALAGLVP